MSEGPKMPSFPPPALFPPPGIMPPVMPGSLPPHNLHPAHHPAHHHPGPLPGPLPGVIPGTLPLDPRAEVAMLRQRVTQLEIQVQQLTQINQHLQQQVVATHIGSAALLSSALSSTRPHNPAWSEHVADGKTYYYNSKTGESVWERPADYNPDAASTPQSSGPKGPPGANLFVLRKLRRGEYDEFSDKDLKDTFGAYGNVLRAEMTKDPDNGWSRGFGFVSFATSEEADEAIKNLNGTWIAGKQLKVEKTRSDFANADGQQY